ncbi:branched-chain amino acid ABC transporter permease [Acrocarpospora catenulata]|uniref:branched-chain amino acid ABC transporter permease n=1 Tax=Acrocarpospora catenulata TaxID=2836182 RepID=UPI001BDA653F|nr:branched-chain amino acid ABC transporter permease [Acrocarpospora catenulata]
MMLAAADWFGAGDSTIRTALVYVLLAYGIHLALRTGTFSLAAVATYGTGAYTAGALALDGWSPVAAVAAAVVQAAVAGLVLALVLARLRNLYLAMATLAAVLLVHVLALEWESVTGGALGLLGIPRGVTVPQLLVIVALCTLAVALGERGRTGRMLEALRLDDQLAASVGIDVVRARRVAFVLSAALGGLAGSLSALQFSVLTPDEISFALIVDVLTIVVIGGTAAWYGPLIGAVALAWLPELLRWTGDLRPIVQAAIVVVLVVCAPDGAAGLIRAVAARLRRLRRRENGLDVVPAVEGAVR